MVTIGRLEVHNPNRRVTAALTSHSDSSHDNPNKAHPLLRPSSATESERRNGERNKPREPLRTTVTVVDRPFITLAGWVHNPNTARSNDNPKEANHLARPHHRRSSMGRNQRTTLLADAMTYSPRLIGIRPSHSEFQPPSELEYRSNGESWIDPRTTSTLHIAEWLASIPTTYFHVGR